MKNWSPYTFILLAALIALAVGNQIPGTYDPLRPHDSPVKQIKEEAKLAMQEQAQSPDGTEEIARGADGRNLEGDPRLSNLRRYHILYGDESGGGHHHTANRPCKTEFPVSWDEDRIIETVKRLAANDNAPWRKEDNGYYVAEQMDGGVEVRVVLDEEGDDIITAYPTNLPRNECDVF